MKIKFNGIDFEIVETEIEVMGQKHTRFVVTEEGKKVTDKKNLELAMKHIVNENMTTADMNNADFMDAYNNKDFAAILQS